MAIKFIVEKFRRGKAGRDMTSSASSTLLLTLVAFAIQMLLVRFANINDYGRYAFTYSIYVVVELLCTGFSSDHALQMLGKPAVGRNYEEINVLLKTLIRQDLVLYAIPLLVAVPLYGLADPTWNFDGQYFLLLVLSLVFQAGSSAVKALFISFNNVGQQVKYEYGSVLLMLALNVTGLVLFGIMGYIVSQILYALLKTQMGLFLIKHFNSRIQFSYAAALRRPYALAPFDGKQMSGSLLRNGLLNLSNNMDIILLGVMASTPALIAGYKVAKVLMTVPTRVVYPIWASLRGRMVEAYHQANFKRLRYLVFKPMVIFFVALMLSAVPAYFLAPYAIKWLFGEAYLPAVPVFIWLFLGNVFFQSTSGWFNLWVILSKKQFVVVYALLVQIVLFVVAVCFFGGSNIEVVGVAYALAMVAMSIFQLIYFKKHTA
jgi:O-antigen/teichoic acid export membrane protein